MHGTEGVNCEGCRAQGLKEKKLVESNLEKVDRLKPIAKELDCSLAQLALAWCIRNEHVSSVITGATKREQVDLTFSSRSRREGAIYCIRCLQYDLHVAAVTVSAQLVS